MTVYGVTVQLPFKAPFDLSSSHLPGDRTIVLSDRVPEALLQAHEDVPFIYTVHHREVYFTQEKAESPDGYDSLCYEVKGIVRFYWKSKESTIYFEPSMPMDKERITFWLVHMLLPLYLVLEEQYHFIHAASVLIDADPVLFMAPSMGGKSTMTEHFLQRGHALLSDDKVALFHKEAKSMVIPSHAYHRPYRANEDFGYRAKKIAGETKVLAAIYQLEKGEPNEVVKIEAVKGFEKFTLLSKQCLYAFPHLRAKQMHCMTQALENTPFFRVTVPWDLERLDDVYGAIYGHKREC